MRILSDISKPIRRVVLFLVSLFLISVILLIALAYWDLLQEKAFGREIGKTLLQVIAVAVLGTTASLMLAEFNRHREALLRKQETQRRLDENKDQLRKEILRKANEIYANTKRARRLLRARAFRTPFYGVWDKTAPIILESYDRYMEDINDSQLELEIIAKEVETNEQAFSNYQEVVEYIRPMEKYLSQIVSEFERQRADFKGTPASLPIVQLKEMHAMLGPTPNGPFATEFIENHRKLMASIRRDLTSPKPDS